MQKVSEEGLVRGIRQWDLVGVVINSIIGAGIFVLPARSFKLIGSYSLIAFILCAFVCALIILCFVEVSSRFTGTGGPYLYAQEAFGPGVGFQVGWMNWIARVSAYATNCNLLIVYLGFFWPAAVSGFRRALIITLITLTLTLINYIGVRDAARASNFFTIAKLLPMALFIAAGLFFMAPDNFSLGEYPSYGSFSTSVLLLLYAFTGFENASVPAGEIVNPRRNLPFAILIARLLAYAATCAALPRLRYKKGVPEALVKIPGGIVISVLAILLSIWLLTNSTRVEARDSAIAVAAGIAIYLGYKFARGSKRAPEKS
jgi:basic amino acid/polyamine antiporter, APA family